jgi:hypothetical protein
MLLNTLSDRGVESRLWRMGISVASSAGVCAILAGFAAVFGSADVEESANTSFSAGAEYAASRPLGGPSGIYSLFGVPVYDTLQGTGDRLPYQGSWAQSVTWPLRFVVGWEHYYLMRTLLFAVPAVFLCVRTLLSWVPRARWWALVAFGFLINSSFGLYVRQNEWSDHYVQTVGTFAVSMFLFHRDFHEPEDGQRFDVPWVTLLCVAVAGNGVVTGHPGFWPISLFVWSATLAVCATSPVFRGQLVRWLRQVWVGALALAVASILTVGVVAADLLTELGAEFGSGRLARTQGLFGSYAFGWLSSIVGTSEFSESLKPLIATVLATLLMPFFMLFDQILPQQIRASSFRELSRVEFSGALVLVALAFAWRRLGSKPIKSLLGRLVVLQALVWCFVYASSRDLLPTTIAASGSWMAIPVIIVVNVFLTFVLLANLDRRRALVSGLGGLNLVLTGVWLLFQLGVMSFGADFHVPDKYMSRLRLADAVSESGMFQQVDEAPGRVVVVNASFYDFLGFTALGVPVVSPSNPKIRDARHLEADGALNFGIDSLEVGNGRELQRYDKVFELLSIEKLVVASPEISKSDGHFGAQSVPIDLSLTDQDVAGLLHPPMRSLELFSRNQFAAFLIERAELNKEDDVCPVLQQSCVVIELSSQVEPRSTPRLQRCDRDCLWTYDTPAVGSSRAVIVPVTFDEALRVRDADGKRVATVNAGGFLGVYADDGLPATMLTVELDPDRRMVSRVAVSYVNFAMLVALLSAMTYAVVIARRRDDTN